MVAKYLQKVKVLAFEICSLKVRCNLSYKHQSEFFCYFCWECNRFNMRDYWVWLTFWVGFIFQPQGCQVKESHSIETAKQTRGKALVWGDFRCDDSLSCFDTCSRNTGLCLRCIAYFIHSVSTTLFEVLWLCDRFVQSTLCVAYHMLTF